MRTETQVLLRKLSNIKKTTSGWQARCPAHDDKIPSLSISEGDDGRILLHCHAGCSFEDILAALRWESRDCMGIDNGKHHTESISAIYDYQDENGNLAYQVVRYARKGFKQRRPDGQGGWIWNLKGIHRVLYCLPEVLGAQEVVVVEGEKDVDNLRALGFTATTNPGGAGKWRARYQSFLKDKHVTVIPDNDKPGRAHAHQVAASIFDVAQSVKIVDLPVADRGDVSDYLKHNSAGDLRQLIDSRSVLTREQVQELLKSSETDPAGVNLKDWLDGSTEYKCEDVVGHLMNLGSLEYEQTRKAAAVKLDFRVTKLDEWREKRNSTAASEALFAPTPKWSEPVNLTDTVNEVLGTIKRYVVMTSESLVATALWICASWIYQHFDVFPYLLLSSPTKRCGKTRLLGLLRHLVNKGLQGANISPAALFRVIEAERPTLLLDEFDQQFNADDLVGLLNSGHERAGAAIRLVSQGKDFVTRGFSTFCPKVIAMIGRPRDTLVDRSVIIDIQRKKPQETLERITAEVTPKLRILQQKLARWSTDVEMLPEVEQLRTTNDREADNWFPLLVVAEMAGENWPERAREAAKALSKDVDDDSTKIQLLHDIRHIFQELGTDRITTTQLLEKLNSAEESPWSEWGHGKGLNARHLAKLLRPFGIGSKDLRIEKQVKKGYEYPDFETTFESYIPVVGSKSAATSATALKTEDLHPLPYPERNKNVAARSTNKNNGVAHVAEDFGGVQGHLFLEGGEAELAPSKGMEHGEYCDCTVCLGNHPDTAFP